MASKWYTNLSMAMVIVLAFFASGAKSQGLFGSEGPSSSQDLSIFQSPGSSQSPSSSQDPGISQSLSTSQSPINKFCGTSDRKEQCSKMVRGATTLHDATRNAVDSALKIAIELQKMYPMLEPALKDLPPKTKKSVLDTCKQNFDRTVDDLKDCLGFVDKNDSGSLNVHLSAATTSDCSDAFDGYDMPKPVADKIEMMLQAADDCLAVSEQI